MADRLLVPVPHEHTWGNATAQHDPEQEMLPLPVCRGTVLTAWPLRSGSKLLGGGSL